MKPGLQDPEKWNRVETISAILELGRDADEFRPQCERLRNDADTELHDRAEKALHWLSARR